MKPEGNNGADGTARADDNAIVVSELRKRFGRQVVLDGVNFDVPNAMVTCIVGPSGGGKTVLLKHLNLLMRPDSGTIIIDRVEVTKLRTRALNQVREKLGMLFQAGALFDSMTIFDNVAFPLVEKTNLSEEKIEARVRETLKSVGLEGVESKFPSELSGGMQKRAALARALVHSPKILMLDEPTTGLDPSRTGAIHRLIRETQKTHGLTVVMVSHDVPAVFEICDRVGFIHQGKMRLYGTPDEVTAARDEIFDQFLAGKAAGDGAELGPN
ncbi:MAG TPA: ATP-binding cassette domain-containing protein [Candidatus Binataceae bacterium]|nr:ATP-binding cassette domain-containing protein [Candidatus Binataceae bacterium]